MPAENSRQELFLKILMERYHPGVVEKVLSKSLPLDKAQKISEISVFFKPSHRLLTSTEEDLSQIHYSWIAEVIEQFPPSFQGSLITSLPISQSRDLIKFKNRSDLRKRPLPLITKKFFQNILHKNIEGFREILKQDFIRPYPLTKLLDMDIHLLFEMFDLLGLYDLSIKLKYVIDKKILSNIYDCFSPSRKKFLLSLIHHTDKIQLSEVDLSNWSGDPIFLKKIIHKKGILRLGKALSGYPKDFMWHLTHKLDTGRGRLLMRYYSEEKLSIAESLSEQVLFIINTLTKKNEP